MRSLRSPMTMLVVAVVAVTAACASPPPSSTPSAQGPCVGATAADRAQGPIVDGAPVVGLDPAQAEVAGRMAADAAGRSGASGRVVVVALDRSGRPQLLGTTAEDAARTAGDLAEAPGTEVLAVEPVREVGLADDDNVEVHASADPRRADQWGLDDLQIEAAWTRATGSGIVVAVVDTGVRADHADLSGRVCGGAAFLGDTGSSSGGGGTDPHGHGTHVAGTIAAGAGDGIGVSGVAPGVHVLPVRVLDAHGYGYDTDTARGIIWAVDNGADVVNVSLGGPATAAMAAAVAYATERGVLVVAAAGNDGPTGPANYPAAFPAAFAVASHTSSRSISTFSTHGAYIDVSAPGSAILSTSRTGGWSWMSGTSMATPHVTGVVALLLEREPHLDAAELSSRLTSTAEDEGAPGKDVAFGWGGLSAVPALDATGGGP